MQAISRLSETFAPEHYDLSLILNRIERTFEGTVTIAGLSPGMDPIKLHAKELTIASALYDGKQAEFAQGGDELTVRHADQAEGKHVVTIGFSGKITDDMHGLYPCYFEHDGVKKELLATQFESHHAREVFPCIDEPAAKATFDLTLSTEPDLIVLGNMPIKNQRTEGTRLVTAFQTTPRMSTYLLAFVVGELQKKTATTKSGVEVNIWATPAQPAESLDFGLDIAVRTIDFFDDYFKTPYPLAKSDHVALPDFSSGAMENWGLITYREVALLSDPKSSTLDSQHYAATVIAHELSHQWFGNLVTMKWWNDLWLNESFANMMEYFSIDALEPGWHIWLDHATVEIISALKRDSLDGVQSIRTDVDHPDEISALFDPSIVYAKGGRLLRMLQTYIGNEAFQQGLQAYFKRHAYQNTEADDLWACFSQASGKDIDSFMNTWISQSGFPLVRVTREGSEYTLTQERFFIGPHREDSAAWPIPLNASDKAAPAVMEASKVKFTADSLVRLNLGATAHFITHYDASLFAELLEDLPSWQPIDRLEFIQEQILLAQAGILPTVNLIPLLLHYKDESEEAVWSAMVIALNELKRFVETDETAEKKLRAFVGELAETQFNRLGWQKVAGETESDTKFRGLIVSQMLYSERPDIVKKAHDLYAATSFEALDPELRTSLMINEVRQARNPQIVDQLLQLYTTTTNSELKEDISLALTSTKDTKTIDRLKALLKDQSVIRMQDFPRWFVWLLRNRHGRAPLWQWVRDEWPWIVKKYRGDMHFDSIPRYIASSLVTRQELEEYMSFFEPLKKEPALKRNIEIGIAEMTGRVELIEQEGDAVRSALLDL